MVTVSQIVAQFPQAKSWWPVMVLVAGVGCVALGLWLFIQAGRTTVSAHDQTLTICESRDQAVLSVDVSGGVVSPGVYSLTVGSLVADAVAAAGGLSETADKEQIARQMNLAQALEANGKLFVPLIGDPDAQEGTLALSGVPSDSSSGRISVNSASQTELMTLPGIGEKRAQDILAGRPYTALSELVEQGIISENMFAEIEQSLSL